MSNPVAIVIARTNNFVFPETRSNDVLMYIKKGPSQNLHFGHANNHGAMLSIYSTKAEIKALEVANNALINGDTVTIGQTQTQQLKVHGLTTITGHLHPTTTNTVDIGESSKRLRTVYTNAMKIGNILFSPSNDTISLTNPTTLNLATLKCKDISIEQSIVVPSYSTSSSGSSNAPSYTWETDPTTGMYRASNGKIGFSLQGSNNITFDQSGVIVNGDVHAMGYVTESSDARLKTNLEPITNALLKIETLQGYTFNKIGSALRLAGVLAQDVEQVFPEVVTTDEDGFKRVAYGNMVSLLLEGIKELTTKHEELAETVSQLQTQIKNII